MYRPLPKELTIKNSPIEGLGLFATKDIKANTFIGVTHIRDEQFENKYIRTPIGGFYNHSNDPTVIRMVSDVIPKLKFGDKIDINAPVKKFQDGEDNKGENLFYNLHEKSDAKFSKKCPLSIKNAHAVECYNHGSAFQERGDGFAILDSLLNNGRKVNIMATDDAHFKVRDYFGAWVMVKCDENSPTKILESLKLGNYYCSQGPTIEDIVVEKGLVKVVSSPIERLVICGDGTASKYITCDKSEKNEIPFGRCEGSPWIRITIIDKKGNRAWTNPIWL